MDYSPSNADLLLLLLISEQPGINGYGIRRLVEERGSAAWAGVASSSIYNGLKRIEQRGLARSTPDTKKQDRGPRGQIFRLTAAGHRTLKHAVGEALASTREHDPRFNIALSGMDQLGWAEGADRLAERAEFLASEHERLSGVETSQQRLPLTADLLFDRTLHAIQAERDWTLNAAERVRRASQDKEIEKA